MAPASSAARTTASVRSGWVWLPGRVHHGGALMSKPTDAPGSHERLHPAQGLEAFVNRQEAIGAGDDGQVGTGQPRDPAVEPVLGFEAAGQAAAPATAPTRMKSRLFMALLMSTSMSRQIR